MPPRPVTIFVSAAEASGDAHAAHLMREIRAAVPRAHFVGVAGPRMAAEGCEVLADLTRQASMLGGPLLRLGFYWRTVRRLRKAIRRLRPDLCIPVDSPALNWHVAAAAKKAGSPVLYYIAPQVWAWAPWRAAKLERLTDRVACILPFEEEYFRSRGVRAKFVGHPIFDAPPVRPGPPPDLTEAWYEGTWQVALLPGSRPGEVAAHAAPLLALADVILGRWPRARCTFALHQPQGPEGTGEAVAAGRGWEALRGASLGRHAGRLDVVAGPGAAMEVLARSHFAVAASGTVTVQAAALGVPMVVFYRTGLLSRFLYRTLGRSRRILAARHLCLVNILAGERIVPELMPWNGGVRALAARVLEVMNDLGHLRQMREELRKAVAALAAQPGTTAAENAARMAVELLAKGE